jgi:vitamin B12 transporter
MQKIFRYSGAFLFVSLVVPTLLWANPPVAEPAGNTLTVESSANTLDSQVSPAMPEVVVTANRLDTPLSQVASSMTVITAKDLEQKQTSTIEKALRGVPGLDLTQTGGPGEISTLFIRGANSENTLVMMDGIPLNDSVGAPFSYDYLDQLMVDGVKQIEVVRGPQSALYGSNAMAGVVNIITQGGKGPLGGSFSFDGGSYGTLRESLSAKGGDESGNFSLAASRFDTAGFPAAAGGVVNNPDQNTTSSLKLASTLAPNVQENLLARYSQSHTSLDAYDPNTFLLADDPDYFVDQKQWMMGSQTRWSLLNGDWEQVLGISYFDDNRAYNAVPNAYNSYFEQGQYDGQTAQVSWQNNLRLSKVETVIVGLQGSEEWGNLSDINNSFGYPVTDAISNANANTESLFAVSQTNLGERFFFHEGGRLDAHSQFGTHVTYQGGLAYFVPGVETKLKVNYGTGFMAPSLYQLYDPTYGTAGLQPETSTGFDFGFEQAFGKGLLLMGATYFHNDFNGLIDFDATSHYININQAQSEGWETFLSAKPASNLKCQVNYTYTWARDLQTGQELLRRPQNKAATDVIYSLGPTEWGMSVNYVGERLDYGAPAPLPEYFLVNLRASFALDEHLKFFTRVDNLLNDSYQEAFGFNTPGLSIFAGTKVAL